MAAGPSRSYLRTWLCLMASPPWPTARHTHEREMTMKNRVNALAERLELGAQSLVEFAGSLTEEEWQVQVPRDGRKVGVTVHHVGNMYPIEIDVAQLAARGEPIVGVTWEVVADINAKHAREFDGVTNEG